MHALVHRTRARTQESTHDEEQKCRGHLREWGNERQVGESQLVIHALLLHGEHWLLRPRDNTDNKRSREGPLNRDITMYNSCFLLEYIVKCNWLLWSKMNYQHHYSCLVSHDPPEIILICWFAAQETFFNYYYVKQLCTFFRILWGI